MIQTRTQWLPIVLLLVGGLFSAAQFGKFTLTLELLGAHYGRWAPFLISVVGMVGIVFGAVAGAHVARFGLRRALLWAMGLGAILSCIEALLPGLPVMLTLRVAEGFSHLAIVVAAPTLMSGFASDRDRPVVMGIWASFFGVALAITALLLPVLLPLGGLSSVLLAHGLGLAVIAATLAWVLPETAPSEIARKSYFAEHVEIYRRPRAAIAGVGFVFYTVLYIALIAVLPPALGLSLTVTSALPVVSLVGTFGAGFFARRYAPPAIAMVGFAMTAGSLGALMFAPGPLAAFGLFLCAGIVPGACFATIPYFNHTVEARARATGAIAQMGNVGTTAGTPIFVGALWAGGLPLVVSLALGFCVAGLTTLALVWRAIGRDDK